MKSYERFIEKYLHKNLFGRDVSYKEIGETPREIISIQVKESDQNVKEILDKYDLKKEDYWGFRKFRKRWKAAREISKVRSESESKIIEFIGEAKKTVTKDNLCSLIGILSAKI
jgi:hypothetical protein